MTRLTRPARTRASFAICLVAATLLASAAAARTERFRWTQTNASVVDNFKLYWGSSSGSYTSSLNVGLPAKDSTGAYYYDVVVPDTATIYACVSAFDNGLESTRSNEISRAGTSDGGTTPPPSGTAQSGVVGFALWNAQANTVVDASFGSGDMITDDIRQCAAIEIKTNAYLNASGPGSIKKVLDGNVGSCTAAENVAPYTVENTYPYGWDYDDGVRFPCSSTLSVIGTHTLTVTPYDGDNCTGLAGTPVSLTFSVAGPNPPPPSTTLGTPGQPYIVQ